LPTSLAALMISARSETLCESIAATFVAACRSVTAGAAVEVAGEAVDAGAVGLAPPLALLWEGWPPCAVGVVPVLAASLTAGWLNGRAISTPATPPPASSTSRAIKRGSDEPERRPSCRRGGWRGGPGGGPAGLGPMGAGPIGGGTRGR
jgi:hypothetical protein